MADCTTADEHSGQSEAAPQGICLLAQQNHQREALRALLEEWAEEAGLPDPKDVVAMCRRYFPQDPRR